MDDGFRKSHRYLCIWCPDGEVTRGDDVSDDDEVCCPTCHEVMTSFPVLECGACREWAATEDAHLLRARHQCEALVAGQAVRA